MEDRGSGPADRQGGGRPAGRPRGTGGSGGSGGSSGTGGSRGTGGPGRKGSGAAKKAAARRRQERRRRTVVALVVGAVVVAAVVVGVLVANRGGGGGGGGQGKPGFDKVATFSGLGRNHVTTAVHYAQNPPVGGDHNPVWQNCGFYTQPVRNENAVHSLEHGTVWITHQPDLAKDQVDRLASLARSEPYLLVSPYPGLPAPVVASAWGVQEWFHSADDPKLSQFIANYRQGPQTPEPGAPCTGGTGTPQ